MKYLIGPLATTITLALAACGRGPGHDNSAAGQNQSAVATPAATQTPSERLLAAAEPFEKLTEIAFSAQLPEIDKTIAEARSAAGSVKPLLSGDNSAGVDKQFAEIDRARGSQDRAGLALASIEIYRAIVSSVPAGTKVPSAVSLLDYAGFRYQADLKAVPIRWQDMNAALAFARTQWTAIAPRLGTDPVRTIAGEDGEGGRRQGYRPCPVIGDRGTRPGRQARSLFLALTENPAAERQV